MAGPLGAVSVETTCSTNQTGGFAIGLPCPLLALLRHADRP
jgi:hypothetical protein